MQARVHGLTKRINRPKLCFRVILIKDHFMKDHFSLSFHSSLFRLIFLIFHFSWFLFHFLCFALAHLYFFGGMSSTSFGTLFSSHLPSSIRHLITYSPLEKSFFAFAFCPPVQGVILGRVIKGNYQAQRGDYRIIFYISEGMMKDGHFSFQTQLPKLKSNSLQEKNDLCFCSFFIIFLTYFLAS